MCWACSAVGALPNRAGQPLGLDGGTDRGAPGKAEVIRTFVIDQPRVKGDILK